MVLAELGGRITRAIQQMSNATIIDEEALNECLNEISRGLLQSDVPFPLVKEMQTSIKKIVSLDDLAVGHNKRRIIEQAIFSELFKMLDPGKPAFAPQKGKPTVVMFVGLQGAGKTTTCTKYAYYHQKKGYKAALVCADTLRAGAFDQLKQNASKAKIPFYGSYTESDPVKIGVEGVDRFKKENCDLIIVDTSGRHKQEASLFEEIRQVAEATKPDLVIFVMDSSCGQAAFDQAQAFKQSVAVGAVIITKMDGHSKGGGALSAVAATKSPVIFIGTGEHMDEFEVFDVKPFVNRLLGRGDPSGLVDELQELVPKEITFRIMYDMFQKILNMGIRIEGYSMVPGTRTPQLMPRGDENEGQRNIERYVTVMNCMTNEELESSNPKMFSESQLMRIAEGSGRVVREVMETLEEFMRIARMLGNSKPFKSVDMMTARLRNMNLQRQNRLDDIQDLINPCCGFKL